MPHESRPVRLPTLLRLFAFMAEAAAHALELGTASPEEVEDLRKALTGVATDALAGAPAAVSAARLLGGPHALLALAQRAGRECPAEGCDGGVRPCLYCRGAVAVASTPCHACLGHGEVYCHEVLG